MKNINKILPIIVLLLTCSFTSNKKEETGSIPQAESVKTIFYRGHTYIVYQFARGANGGGGRIIGGSHRGGSGTISNVSGAYGGAGLVHDPDCQCQNSKKELVNKLNTILSDSIIINFLKKD